VLVAFLGGELVLAGSCTAASLPRQSYPIPFSRRVGGVDWPGCARPGPVFAADQHGGYLSFTVPSLRPYIDTRLVLHTEKEYADYLALFDDPARFDDLAARENFGAVVLPTAYPDRYLGLIWHLVGSAAWRLACTDGYEVLFCAKALDLRSASAQPSTPSWMSLPRGLPQQGASRCGTSSPGAPARRARAIPPGRVRAGDSGLAAGRAASRARATLPPESFGPPSAGSHPAFAGPA